MKFLKFLNEEFLRYVRIWKDTHPVYINPTAHDFSDIRKEWKDDKYKNARFELGDDPVIRFIAYPNQKKIYTWNSYDAIHETMFRILSLPQRDCFWGDGPLNRNNKIDISTSGFHSKVNVNLEDFQIFDYCLEYRSILRR